MKDFAAAVVAIIFLVLLWSHIPVFVNGQEYRISFNQQESVITGVKP